METVNAGMVKENFFDYLDKAEQGQTIIIQRKGHNPVKLVPVKKRVIGSLKGKIEIPDDFDEPDDLKV